VTYPGLPVPEAEVIVDHDSSRERYQFKSEFLIASLHLCGNTGTYEDSPLHRHRGATDLAGLPLERVAHVPVRLFYARALGRAVGPELFDGADLRGAAVLVRTDFSRHAAERRGHPDPFDDPFGEGSGVESGDAAQRGRRLHPVQSVNRNHGRARGRAAPALRGDNARERPPDARVAAAVLRPPAGQRGRPPGLCIADAVHSGCGGGTVRAGDLAGGGERGGASSVGGASGEPSGESGRHEVVAEFAPIVEQVSVTSCSAMHY
jgi:hypothetical protein